MADSERRMERFDEFFLFIASALGLFFSFLYTLLGYREIVSGFFPLLLIGLVIPVYIGYVRGAILLDMLEERVRGWIYFLYGVFVYIILITGLAICEVPVILNIEYVANIPLSFFVGVGTGVLLGFFLSSKRLYRWFCQNIFAAFDQKMTKLNDRIYDETSRSAFLVTMFLFISTMFSISETRFPELETFNPQINFTIVLGCFVVAVAFFVWSERGIRKWVSLVRFSDFIEIESKKARPYIPTWVRAISSLISAIAILLLFLLPWLPLLVRLGLLIAFLVCLILSYLSMEKKHIPIRKKDVPKHIEMELTKLLNRITEKQEKGKHKKTNNQ